MICPNCKTEYREGFAVCADCNINLVSELPLIEKQEYALANDEIKFEKVFETLDNRKYTYTSAEIVKILLEYTPLVEVFSIDESFMDLTGRLRMFGSAERIAYLIKAR